MRESALPSRTNQARVVSEVLELARRENFRVSLFEAYDESWKREIEGTVGGSWGLFNSAPRTLKYPPGFPISNFPLWKLQMGGGMALASLVFGVAWLTLRRKPRAAQAHLMVCGRDIGNHSRNPVWGGRPKDVL